MGKINRRVFILFLLFIVCCMALAAYVFANGDTVFKPSHTMTREYIWYCLPHKEGVQPNPTEKAGFIADYPVVFAGGPQEKIIYLTFDDSSSRSHIEDILDILKKHGAQAAFFMTEHYMRKHPDIVRRIADEGHIVGNHTSRHIIVSKIMDFEKFKKELSGVEEAYKEATGEEIPKFFRPPEGRFSELTLKYAALLGYTTVFWSCCYADWTGGEPPLGKIEKTILDDTHPGEILLLHTQSAANVKILEPLLNGFAQMGYTFGSLNELKKDAGQ
jgi:peptidoglycan-N-acetylmuramic acid deacetylase